MELRNEQERVESLHNGYLRYELLLNRIQAVTNGNITPVALAKLHALAGTSPPQTAENSTAPIPLAAALDAFEQDCSRVALFYRAQHQHLWAAVLEAVSHLRNEAEGLGFHSHTAQHAQQAHHEFVESRLAALREKLDAIGQGAVALDTFAQQNVSAVVELALLADGEKRVLDAALPTAASPKEEEYKTAAELALLGVLRLDSILLGLSDAYALLHLAEHDAHAAALTATGEDLDEAWVPPQKFTRVTRKFWIRIHDVMKFKTEVVKHLPVLVYGARRKLTSIDPGELPFLPAPTDYDSSPITSVYIDSLPGLVSYHSRLRRDDGATAVRLRWYGKRDPGDPDQTIFVERKVHREAVDNPGDGSVKERVGVPQEQIPALLAGLPVELPQGISQHDVEFIADVQSYIVTNRQAPLLRTRYRRTAFQLKSHNRIRISLDTDLHMIAERSANTSLPPVQYPTAAAAAAGAHWCHNDASLAALPPSATIRFPYAVVEVKLQEAPPEWLQDLVRAEILLPVPKFSKFLHGTAVLYQRWTRNVPYWFLADYVNPNLLTPATWEEMVEPSAEAVKDAAAWLFPSGFEPPSPQATNNNNKSFWRWRSPRQQQHQSDAAAGGAGEREGKEEKSDTTTDVSALQLPATNLPVSHITTSQEVFNPSTYQAAAGDDVQVKGSSPKGTMNGQPRRTPWRVYQSPPIGLPHVTTNSNSNGGGPSRSGSEPDVGSGSDEVISIGDLSSSACGVVSIHSSVPSMPSAGGSTGHGSTGRSSPQGSVLVEDLEMGVVPSAVPCVVPSGGAVPLPGTATATADVVQKQCQVLEPVLRANMPRHDVAAPLVKDELKEEGGQPPLPPNKRSSLLPMFSSMGSSCSLPQSGPPRPMVRTRVEPKTFFANERTFLQWLQISVLVMFLAMSLLNGSTVLPGQGSSSASSSSSSICAPGDGKCIASKISGALIAPVALVFMGYALFMYRKRTQQILRRETVRYDDQRGPAVLVVILLIVMIISYVISMIYVF